MRLKSFSDRPNATIQTLLVSAAAMALAILPSRAGPCTSEIDRLQAAVDAKIEAIAATGPTAPESVEATRHDQPTPGSIAAAEEKLGAGPDMTDAVAALKRAREADNANDTSACDEALAEVRRLLSQ
ncbi:MAG: hypothetical protein R3D52_13935 [Xanthobacteraceae bacterium]